MARRSDHSREQIHNMALAACESLVSEYGIDGLSTRKVAAEIGYSAGTLYQVFNNFDDLIMQLNARTLHRLHSSMLQQQRNTAYNRLQQYGHCYLNFAYKQPALWQLLFQHRPANPDNKPLSLQKNIDALFQLLGQALTELQPSMDKQQISLAANTLWSSIHGITVLMLQNKLHQGSLQQAQQSVDYLIGHFINGWQRQE